MQQLLDSPSVVYWQHRAMAVSAREGAARAKIFPLEKPYARIGSHSRSEVVLPERAAPARGLYLHATDQGIYCLSLEPAAAGRSFPNGWLRPKVHARLGDYRINADFSDHGLAPRTDLADLREATDLGPDAPWIRIESRGPTRASQQQPLRRRLTLVGSRPPSKILLDHPSVSGVHCVLFWDGVAMWAVDLVSDHGTLLDGALVEAAEVKPGQQLDVGVVRLTYVTAVEASRAQSPVEAFAAIGDVAAASIPDLSSAVEAPAETEPMAKVESVAPGEPVELVSSPATGEFERRICELQAEVEALRATTASAAAAAAQDLDDRYSEWRELHARSQHEAFQALADRDAAFELAAVEESRHAALAAQFEREVAAFEAFRAAAQAELAAAQTEAKAAQTEAKAAQAAWASVHAELAAAHAELAAMQAREQAALGESISLRSERGAAIAQRDALAAERETILVEREAAIAEHRAARHAAAAEHEQALVAFAAARDAQDLALADGRRRFEEIVAQRDAIAAAREEVVARLVDLQERYGVERAETVALYEGQLADLRCQFAAAQTETESLRGEVDLLSQELTLRTEEWHRESEKREASRASEADAWQTRLASAMAERDAAVRRAGETSAVAVAAPPALPPSPPEQSAPFRALRQRFEGLERDYTQLLTNRDDLVAKLNAFLERATQAERERDLARRQAEAAHQAAEAVRQQTVQRAAPPAVAVADDRLAAWNAERKETKRDLAAARETERSLRRQVYDLEHTLATVRERCRFFEAALRESRDAPAAKAASRAGSSPGAGQ